jgi:hypothetical protein
MQPHPLDEGKDFVRQHQRRQAQQRFDSSDRPWELQNDPLLRRPRLSLRLYFTYMGIAVLLVIGLVFLLSFYWPAGGPG